MVEDMSVKDIEKLLKRKKAGGVVESQEEDDIKSLFETSSEVIAFGSLKQVADRLRSDLNIDPELIDGVRVIKPGMLDHVLSGAIKAYLTSLSKEVKR